MGLVMTTGYIGLGGDGLRALEFLVDTGSFYTFLPPTLAADIGITFPVSSSVVLADSGIVKTDLGVAYLRLMDREGGIPVASIDVPIPLLGAGALEVLGLNVNPVDETLALSRPFGPAALRGDLIWRT